MKSLLLFCSIAVALLIQVEANVSKESQKLAPKALIEIAGESYFFDGMNTGYWEDGNLACQALNMRLVTFENEDKWNSFVQFITANPELLDNLKSSCYNVGYNYEIQQHVAYDAWWWTGGRRTLDTTEFFWSGSNNAFNFTAWNSGEPDSSLTRDACVNFLVNWGGWDDDGCNQYTFGYICENIPA